MYCCYVWIPKHPGSISPSNIKKHNTTQNNIVENLPAVLYHVWICITCNCKRLALVRFQNEAF